MVPKKKNFFTILSLLDWCCEYVFWLVFYYIDRVFMASSKQYHSSFSSNYLDTLPDTNTRQSRRIKDRNVGKIVRDLKDSKVIAVLSQRLSKYHEEKWYDLDKYFISRYSTKWYRLLGSAPKLLGKPTTYAANFFDWPERIPPYKSKVDISLPNVIVRKEKIVGIHKQIKVLVSTIKSRLKTRVGIARWDHTYDEEEEIALLACLKIDLALKYASGLPGVSVLYNAIYKITGNTEWKLPTFYPSDYFIYGNTDFFGYYYYDLLIYLYFYGHELIPLDEFFSYSSYHYIADIYELLAEIMSHIL